MRRIVLFATACCTLALAAGPAGAGSFGLSGFGGKLGYAVPEDLDGTLHAGAHLEFESAGTRVHILPSLMFWKSEDVSDVNPNIDAYYHFNSEGLITPYVGGGVGMHFVNDDATDASDTNLGANLFAGLRIPGTYNHYFVEGRYTASDVSSFSILGGVTFHR